MSKELYVALYFFTVFVHYFVTAGLLYWIVVKKFKLSFFWLLVIWILIWLSAGLLCHGCPYTYLQEYFANKAWGTEITYNFSKSLLYRFIFKHF